MHQEHPYQIDYTCHQDHSKHKTIHFMSPADGTEQTVEVYYPEGDITENIPLVIGPHPITWKAEEEYCGGPVYLYKQGHCGYYGLADRFRVIIALPHGHHHAVENCSLGNPAQIKDLGHLPDILITEGFPIDKRRVYIIGNSMGGQEALLTAGQYPDRITACVASNPVIDLAMWYSDLKNGNDPEINKFKTWDLISNEVGGTPEELPEEYNKRSAFTLIDQIKNVPSMIFWSDYDRIVPHQKEHQSYRFYQELKRKYPTAPISEFNHSHTHGVPEQNLAKAGYEIHEWSDYELYIQWCLRWIK